MPNALKQRLVTFSVRHHVPWRVLAAFMSRPWCTTNSSWLVHNPAPAPMDIKDIVKVYLDLALKHLAEDSVSSNSLAAEWLGHAAANGNADAQRLLGRMCALGQGVPKNDAKAITWLGKAATQGVPGALFDLDKVSRLGSALYDSATPAPFEAVTPRQILEARNRADEVTPAVEPAH